MSERSLYLCLNWEGDVTADTDVDAAIKRMDKEFGGGGREHYRIVEVQLRVPVAGDYIKSLIAHLPDAEQAQIMLDLEHPTEEN